jgi:ADP-heptose:LPS heptosyltransferase
VGPDALLVVHPGALGDLVVAFDSLLRLRRRFPGGIDGVCQGHLGRLAAGLGIFRRAVAMEAAVFAGLYTDASGGVDTALVDFFRPYKAVLLFSNSTALAQGVRRVFRKPLHRIPPRPPRHRRIHVHDHLMDQLAAEGLLRRSDTAALFPPGFPSLKTGTDGGTRGAAVFIHPGSGSPRKNWPLERFAALARRLLGAGMRPEFVLGPAEGRLRATLLEDDGPWPCHTPATLDDFAARLTRGGAYVGNDAGGTHLAAFLGLPTLALFGPSDPLRWRPRGRRTSVLTAPGAPCDPCFEHHGRNCDGAPCLSAITVDDAAARLSALLDGGGGDASG